MHFLLSTRQLTPASPAWVQPWGVSEAQDEMLVSSPLHAMLLRYIGPVPGGNLPPTCGTASTQNAKQTLKYQLCTCKIVLQ